VCCCCAQGGLSHLQWDTTFHIHYAFSHVSEHWDCLRSWARSVIRLQEWGELFALFTMRWLPAQFCSKLLMSCSNSEAVQGNMKHPNSVNRGNINRRRKLFCPKFNNWIDVNWHCHYCYCYWWWWWWLLWCGGDDGNGCGGVVVMVW
jgi:hypothetical protein